MAYSVELEVRTCKCGCGMTFKCLPTSLSQYASQKHMPEYQEAFDPKQFRRIKMLSDRYYGHWEKGDEPYQPVVTNNEWE